MKYKFLIAQKGSRCRSVPYMCGAGGGGASADVMMKNISFYFKIGVSFISP